ncbi:RT0821/Lpp0805 family surface protein [Roseibium sp.]|uniref:RT0821/Lpp0805 family surface protein n=1 Tax=Roseibium sp. TaxID=1936156 RepID=UPI003A970058
MFHRMTYTAPGTKIQSLACACALVSLSLAGCGQVSMPLGSADVETPLVLTGSIPSATEIAFTDIGDGDRQLIAHTLDLALGQMNGSQMEGAEAGDDAPRAGLAETMPTWNNPRNGNSGKIIDIDRSAEAGTGCIAFKTTANTIAGVKIYAGSACRDVRKQLSITSLAVGDA